MLPSFSTRQQMTCRAPNALATAVCLVLMSDNCIALSLLSDQILFSSSVDNAGSSATPTPIGSVILSWVRFACICSKDSAQSQLQMLANTVQHQHQQHACQRERRHQHHAPTAGTQTTTSTPVAARPRPTVEQPCKRFEWLKQWMSVFCETGPTLPSNLRLGEQLSKELGLKEQVTPHLR